MSSGAVAGIVVVVAVLLVAAAVTVGVFYCRRRSRTAVPQNVSITYSCFNKIQVHLNKLECRGKVHLFQ